MLQKIRWFLFLFAILVVVVTAFQNHEPVDVKMLWLRGRYPLTLVLLATAAISFVAGALATFWRGRHHSKPKDKGKSKHSRTADPARPKSKKSAPEPFPSNGSSGSHE